MIQCVEPGCTEPALSRRKPYCEAHAAVVYSGLPPRTHLTSVRRPEKIKFKIPVTLLRKRNLEDWSD